MKNNRNKKKVAVLSTLLIIIISISSIILVRNGKEDLRYDQLVTQVRSGEVVKIDAKRSEATIKITMKDGSIKSSVIPSLEEFSALVIDEIEKGASIEMQIEESLDITFVKYFSSMLVFAVVFKFLMTKDNVRSYVSVKSNVKFEDVAGLDEEKKQLEEIVKFLKGPRKYLQNGAKIPKGVLLYGEPGTGKTLLAKAIAGEAGVPFFEVTGSLFEEMFVGVGASRIRNLFKKAKKHAPCIIFIDELDAVARRRYDKGNYSEQSLNQLLAEMDGFKSNDNVIVIAATNHKEVLDKAILRKGRFDRLIHVTLPDVTAREEILCVHAKNKKMSKDVDMKKIAMKTVGLSGADLENILNEAAIDATNQGKTYISARDIDEAIIRILVGLEKKNVFISQEDRRITATHEAGHAIVSAILRPNVKNFGISIMQRGETFGYNYFDVIETKHMQYTDLINQICVLYGGRVAENIILGEVSVGAADDLKKASKIAYSMVSKFAMGESLLVANENEPEYSKGLIGKQIEEAEAICKKLEKETEGIIKENRQVIQELASLLLEKEFLSTKEIDEFLNN